MDKILSLDSTLSQFNPDNTFTKYLLRTFRRWVTKYEVCLLKENKNIFFRSLVSSNVHHAETLQLLLSNLTFTVCNFSFASTLLSPLYPSHPFPGPFHLRGMKFSRDGGQVICSFSSFFPLSNFLTLVLFISCSTAMALLWGRSLSKTDYLHQTSAPT